MKFFSVFGVFLAISFSHVPLASSQDYQPEERIPVGAEVFRTLQTVTPSGATAPRPGASAEKSKREGDRSIASLQGPVIGTLEGFGPNLDDELIVEDLVSSDTAPTERRD